MAIFRDDFNGGSAFSGPRTAQGSANAGWVWSVLYGTASGLSNSSFTLRFLGSNGGGLTTVATTPSVGSDDQFAQARIPNERTSTDAPILLVRASGASSAASAAYGLRKLTQTNPSTSTPQTTVELLKIVNDAVTVILTMTEPNTCTADMWKISAVGSTISAHRNGRLIGSVTDATIASGSPGIMRRGSAAYTEALDEFTGGSVANPTPPSSLLSQRVTVCIPGSKIPATLPGFHVLLTDFIPGLAGELLSASTGCQSNGGDIRLSSDAAGLNELPIDVVYLDKTAGKFQIWTTLDLTADTDALIYVWWRPIGAAMTAYNLAAPYGGYEVWFGEREVLLPNLTNSMPVSRCPFGSLTYYTGSNVSHFVFNTSGHYGPAVSNVVDSLLESSHGNSMLLRMHRISVLGKQTNTAANDTTTTRSMMSHGQRINVGSNRDNLGFAASASAGVPSTSMYAQLRTGSTGYSSTAPLAASDSSNWQWLTADVSRGGSGRLARGWENADATPSFSIAGGASGSATSMEGPSFVYFGDADPAGGRVAAVIQFAIAGPARPDHHYATEYAMLIDQASWGYAEIIARGDSTIDLTTASGAGSTGPNGVGDSVITLVTVAGAGATGPDGDGDSPIAFATVTGEAFHTPFVGWGDSPIVFETLSGEGTHAHLGGAGDSTIILTTVIGSGSHGPTAWGDSDIAFATVTGEGNTAAGDGSSDILLETVIGTGVHATAIKYQIVSMVDGDYRRSLLS